ncbi:MAG: hypothetical protein ACLTZT_15075 [Butyricimonas faecalis]
MGGIGSCGRKLCCSTFITNFISVSTSAARYQDISLNPQKLAGQCEVEMLSELRGRCLY